MSLQAEHRSGTNNPAAIGRQAPLHRRKQAAAAVLPGQRDWQFAPAESQSPSSASESQVRCRAHLLSSSAGLHTAHSTHLPESHELQGEHRGFGDNPAAVDRRAPLRRQDQAAAAVLPGQHDWQFAPAESQSPSSASESQVSCHEGAYLCQLVTLAEQAVSLLMTGESAGRASEWHHQPSRHRQAGAAAPP